MKTIVFLVLTLTSLHLQAQDKPYYYEIPAEPEVYTATTVFARRSLRHRTFSIGCG